MPISYKNSFISERLGYNDARQTPAKSWQSSSILDNSASGVFDDEPTAGLF